MLFCENTLGKNITAFDLKTFEKRAEFSLGTDVMPDDLCASPDGRILYVNGAFLPEEIGTSESGREKLSADYDGKPQSPVSSGSVHLMASDRSVFVAFDTQTFSELWRVEIRGHVGHLAISPDGRFVYNALFDRFFVARVDTQTREVTYIPVPFNGGHGVSVGQDGSLLYVASILMAELAILDTNSGAVRKRILFRDNVRPFAVTKDGATAYVQTSFYHGFSVVDLKEGRVVREINLPKLPDDTPVIEAWPHTVDHGMALTADESRLLALATTGNSVTIYSHPDLTCLGTVPLGKEPSWIITDAASKFAYCSNRLSDDISVVSISEMSEVRRFHAGFYPQRMWIAGGH